MTTLTPPDALALAKTFKVGALAVGQFQLDQWDTLSKSQRQSLADSEFALLDHSQNLITSAVGLRLDDAQTSLAAIQQATALANQAIQRISDSKQVLAIAAVLVALGATITTGNPSGIPTVISNLLALLKD